MSIPDITSLNGVGVVGLCVFVMLCLFFEVIVSGRTHRRALAAKDAEIATLKGVIDVQNEHLSELKEVGHTVDSMLRSITDLAQRRRSS